MYSIQWHNGNDYVLVGELTSIFNLAILLEEHHFYFKVSDVTGFSVSPEQCGFGSFRYWKYPTLHENKES